MTPKTFLIILIVVVVVALLGAGGWYIWSTQISSSVVTPINNPSGFQPLNRPGNGTGTTTTNTSTTTKIIITSTTTTQVVQKVPTLRLLSDAPVGGYGVMDTATTTIIRWVDRGRGNVYEANMNMLGVATLSNIVLPRVYESSWNKSLSAFIGSTLEDNSETISAIYAELKARPQPKTATSTTVASTTDITPYELKGTSLPDNTLAYVTSPDKSKIFILTKSDNGGAGYIANFDGTKMTKIFTTPLTQINVEWPSNNIIAVTTKGSASSAGYLYFVNSQTGVWKKILGPLNGLSTKVSRDGKYVFLSVTGTNEDSVAGIYVIAQNKPLNVSLNTLADKCVWGKFNKELVYCGVPFLSTPGTYPDDWYKGAIASVDKIWQINAVTGETKLIGQIIGEAGRVIDSFNFGVDENDNYLFFMNKSDLSLWSLDLVRNK
jgi:hypothetical protein